MFYFCSENNRNQNIQNKKLDDPIFRLAKFDHQPKLTFSMQFFLTTQIQQKKTYAHCIPLLTFLVRCLVAMEIVPGFSLYRGIYIRDLAEYASAGRDMGKLGCNGQTWTTR
jgi:hypothetical protein